MAHLLFVQNTTNPRTTNCDSNPTHPYPGTKSQILLLQSKKSQPSIYLFIFNNLFNNKSNDFNLLNHGEPHLLARGRSNQRGLENELWRRSRVLLQGLRLGRSKIRGGSKPSFSLPLRTRFLLLFLFHAIAITIARFRRASLEAISHPSCLREILQGSVLSLFFSPSHFISFTYPKLTHSFQFHSGAPLFVKGVPRTSFLSPKL